MNNFRPHVLVVTDHQDLALFLQEGLLSGGFWVSVVASAIQTLEVLRLRGFDLIIVDGGLASLGAIEMIRRLRARTDVPVVLIDETNRTIGAGDVDALSVIRPPIDLEDVVPLLHVMVAQWQRARPDRLTADEAAQKAPPAGSRERRI